MRLELTGRHLAITPATRALVAERLEHTLRLLNDSVVSAHVVLTRERARIRAEVTLHARGERFLHGEATGQSVDLALNTVADKIDGQARKLKGKWDGRRRRGPSAAKTTPAEGTAVRPSTAPATSLPTRRRIIRARQYAVKPMSVEDAALEIDDSRDGVIVFRNAATDTVTVLFRRPDGHLGLIEPEA